MEVERGGKREEGRERKEETGGRREETRGNGWWRVKRDNAACANRQLLFYFCGGRGWVGKLCGWGGGVRDVIWMCAREKSWSEIGMRLFSFDWRCWRGGGGGGRVVGDGRVLGNGSGLYVG